MPNQNNNKLSRIAKLHEVSDMLLKTGNARSFILANPDFLSTVVPSDFITLFDEIIQQGTPLEDVKALSNKLLNIFHLPIREFKSTVPPEGSFLYILEQNNKEMERILDEIRPVFKSFVKDPAQPELRTKLKLLFSKLEIFAKHYTIKENVLFPLIEKSWPDYRCVQIMWSFHDDIRKNIGSILEQLQQSSVSLKQFNRCVGDVFFNMLAIKFREEHILFPYILSSIDKHELSGLHSEAFELGYPYVQPEKPVIHKEIPEWESKEANLGSGVLSVEQIKLIFNHLPVDITFVDEHNKVKYFSNPPIRIFPRTLAIIGRDVKNCHPRESVHVVEQIVESFRKGEKSHADFWIKMRGKFILIQYFALRDEQKNYKGVIEVSQEVSEIRALEGEKRLLDW
ncbi:MAG: PAS domain-containing protein [Lentimicrobiaceae bacterium]|nr:PAS domain-containing protein [Lentimicrobiaceae bacterium]